MFPNLKRCSILMMASLLVFGLLGQAAANGFDITFEPIGHWHVFDSKALTVQVRDTDDQEGVTGLNLVVQITRVGSERVTERSVADGRVTDMGDGTYTVEYTPSSLGAYAVMARFTHDESEQASAPIPFEVAKAGEEGVMAVVDGVPFVYQVRYVWEPGHIHANDDEAVTLSFEIMRGLEEGDAINWAQPWRNMFDHVSGATDVHVELMSADGSVLEMLMPTYHGRGIYEVERVFPVAEVAGGMDYEVRFVFTDPYNGAEVTHGEAFELHAVPSH
jgi:hypothetical protein